MNIAEEEGAEMGGNAAWLGHQTEKQKKRTQMAHLRLLSAEPLLYPSNLPTSFYLSALPFSPGLSPAS